MEIQNCTAEFDGGAFYLENPLNMSITTSTIYNCIAGLKPEDNTQDGEGGGILYDCNIDQNYGTNYTSLE